MTIPPFNTDAIVLAAYVARAFIQSHRLAYAEILPGLRLGMTSPNFSALLDQPWLSTQDLTLPELLCEFVGAEATIQAIFDGTEPGYTIERVNRILPDGSTIYLNFYVLPMDPQNPSNGLLLLIEDVTGYGNLEQHLNQSRNELRLAQTALLSANQELERLSRFKSFMISMAAHDMRSFLGVIMLYVDIQRRDMLTDNKEKQSQNLDIIYRQVRLMSDIFDNLLSMDQAERGKLSLRLNPCDIQVVLRSAVNNLQVLASDKDLQLTLEMPEPQLLLVADSARIKQIIYNLVGNAIKYTHEGGSVHVSLSRDGEQAVLSVKDDGQGMSADQIARLFQPFYRTQEAEDSSVTGSGLGLYITRILVEAHHGTIEVASQVNQGSTFTVRLPLRQPGEADELSGEKDDLNL